MSYNLIVKPIEDKNIWENFIKSHPEANFLHSWHWGGFHSRLGHAIERRGFYEDDQLIGVLLAIIEPARRGRHVVVPGGPILDWSNKGLVNAWTNELKNIADDVIYIPETLEILTPILTFVPMQLLAYYISVERGNDVDKPRNLAKSVTVE